MCQGEQGEMMTENKATTIRARLPQLVVTTSSLDIMLTWYCNVLGMSLVHRTDSANGGPNDEQAFKAAWVTNDETDHRLVLVELPEDADPEEADPEDEDHQRLPHFAFQFRHLDELLDTYVRLKGQGILPILCIDDGAKASFHYEDPEHNSVELSVDNYGDGRISDEHPQRSSQFIKKPIEHCVDPDQLIAARKVRA
jgi:catechol 2,3-dioxygenase